MSSLTKLAPATEKALIGFIAGLATCAQFLGDSFRARYGRFLVWLVQKYAGVAIPNSEIFSAKAAAETVRAVQIAMDAENSAGVLGGWRAGQQIIDTKRKAGAALFTLPENLAVTFLMGLPGKFTPVFSQPAQKLFRELKEQYTASGAQDYLYTQAHQAAVQRLIEADKANSYVGAGVLKKMFATRKTGEFELGMHAREKAVLVYFQNTAELRKFLFRDDRGNTHLPRGTSYEEFAASMLSNAYGNYASHGVAHG